jgi:phage terminase small subunit
MKSTARKEQFCQYYCVTGNGTKSAVSAGYSQKTANEQAARLLVFKPELQS